MGQVPVCSTYDLIIGRGRIAAHLSHYLDLTAHPYPLKHWHRDLSESKLTELISKARVVFACIKDDALSGFLQTYQQGDTRFVHFSGSQTFSKAFGAHPLMSFSTELYTKELYEQIPFVVDQDSKHFREIFPTLKNKVYEINPEQKAFYHALCVLSGNFTTVMWSSVAQEMQDQLHLPKDVLNLYLQTTAQNTLKNQFAALTGPLARGDQKVIDTHLAILRETPWYGLYQNLIQTYERFSP